MEIYREVCAALERLYERSNEAPGAEPSPHRAPSQHSADSDVTLSPADANYQVCNITNYILKLSNNCSSGI